MQVQHQQSAETERQQAVVALESKYREQLSALQMLHTESSTAVHVSQQHCQKLEQQLQELQLQGFETEQALQMSESIGQKLQAGLSAKQQCVHLLKEELLGVKQQHLSVQDQHQQLQADLAAEGANVAELRNQCLQLQQERDRALELVRQQEQESKSQLEQLQKQVDAEHAAASSALQQSQLLQKGVDAERRAAAASQQQYQDLQQELQTVQRQTCTTQESLQQQVQSYQQHLEQQAMSAEVKLQEQLQHTADLQKALSNTKQLADEDLTSMRKHLLSAQALHDNAKASWQEELQQTEERLAKLQLDLQSQCNQTQQLQQAQQQLQHEYDSLALQQNKQKAASNSEQHLLQVKLDHMSCERDHLRQQLQSLLSELLCTAKLLTAVTQQQHNTSQMNSSLQQQQEHLKCQLQDSLLAQDGPQQQLQEAQLAVDQSNQQLAAKDDIVHDLKQQLTAVQQCVQQLQGSNMQLEADLADNCRVQRLLQTQNHELARELAGSKAESLLAQENAGVEAKQELQACNQQLQTEAVSSQYACKQLQCDMPSIQEVMQEQQEGLRELQSWLTQHAEQKTAMQQQLKSVISIVQTDNTTHGGVEAALHVCQQQPHEVSPSMQQLHTCCTAASQTPSIADIHSASTEDDLHLARHVQPTASSAKMPGDENAECSEAQQCNPPLLQVDAASPPDAVGCTASKHITSSSSADSRILRPMTVQEVKHRDVSISTSGKADTQVGCDASWSCSRPQVGCLPHNIACLLQMMSMTAQHTMRAALQHIFFCRVLRPAQLLLGSDNLSQLAVPYKAVCA